MHAVLLVLGLASVLIGAAMAYGGYVNFDFSYGGTLAVIAVVAIIGGLLLVAAGAILGQLKRIRIALDQARSLRAASGSAGLSERADEAEAEEHRLPVLPPRPARRQTSDSDLDHDAPGGAPEVSSPLHAAERSEPADLPRLNRADRPRRGDGRGESGAWEPAAREEMTGVSEDIVPAQGGGSTATILKSGVIEGMAYTLYSDGSVEAELPQGIMRFESVTEWRQYLRGA